jgi:hypothetical protein
VARAAVASGVSALLRISADEGADFLRRFDFSGFGLNRDEYDRLVHTTDSVIHCAASLNRKSEKSCLNVNLRGHARSAHAGAARRALSRPAAVQRGQHGCGGGQAQSMKS